MTLNDVRVREVDVIRQNKMIRKGNDPEKLFTPWSGGKLQLRDKRKDVVKIFCGTYN